MTSPLLWHQNVLIFRDYSAQGSRLQRTGVGKLAAARQGCRNGRQTPQRGPDRRSGVTMVQVHAVDAIDSAGSVVISASGSSSAGQHVSMLCFVGPDGKISRTVQTNPFLAFVVRVVPDGTIWAIGADIHGVGRKSGELFTASTVTSSETEANLRDSSMRPFRATAMPVPIALWTLRERRWTGSK